MRVDFLSPIFTKCDGELLLNEAEQVKLSIVDSHVADRNSQTATAYRRRDVLEVQHLVGESLNLTNLFNLDIVDACRPYLIACYAGNQTCSVRQSQAFVQCRQDFVDGQHNRTGCGDIACHVGSAVAVVARSEQYFTLGLLWVLAGIGEQFTKTCGNGYGALLAEGIGMLHVSVDALHALVNLVELTADGTLLHLLVFRQLPVCSLDVQLAQAVVLLSTVSTQLLVGHFIDFLH